MECNKDEALMAKSMAEEKIAQNDFAGAKRVALIAQNLYPELEGISQMLKTIDVYISAETKLGGEADWYGVLGLDPSVDEEAIKKQYRKLALMLHPDKNKTFGANGAFAIILDAYGLLSDKPRRVAYHQRMVRLLQQRVPMPTEVPSPSAPPPTTGCGVSNFWSKPPSNTPTSLNKSTKTPKPAPKPAPTSRPTSSFQRGANFWTTCYGCRVQYQYHLRYLNHTLICIRCDVPFTASPAPPPQNPIPATQVPEQPRCSSSTRTPRQTQGRYMPGAQTRDNGQAGPSLNYPIPPTQVPEQPQCSSSNHTPRQAQGRYMPAAQTWDNGQAGPSQSYPIRSTQVPEQPRCSWSNYTPSQTQGRYMPAVQTRETGRGGPSFFWDMNYQQGPLPGMTDPSVGATSVHMDNTYDKLKRPFAESSPQEESIKKGKVEDYFSPFRVNYNAGPGNGGFGYANSSAPGWGSRFFGFSRFSGYSNLRPNEAGPSGGTGEKEHDEVNKKVQ